MFSRLWFVFSIRPLDYGWQLEERLYHRPKSRAEGLPLSGCELWATVLRDVPGDSMEVEHMLHQQLSHLCRWNKLFRSRTKYADLETRSTTVMITVCPWEGSSPVTKSTAVCDQGLLEITSEWRRPAGGGVGTMTSSIYHLTSRNSWLIEDGWQLRGLRPASMVPGTIWRTAKGLASKQNQAGKAGCWDRVCM